MLNYTQWINNAPLTFTNWRPNDPKDFTVEDCVIIVDRRWADIPCNSYGTRIICEYNTTLMALT
jgi:hypothetical protein